MESKSSGQEKRQLTALKNNEQFRDLFARLIKNDNQFSDIEQEFLLSCSIILFRYYNLDKRYLSYFKLGYYIILKHSILLRDYKPLYDISLQIGFYPISDFLLKKELVSAETIGEQIVNRSISRKYLSFENYIETLEQNTSSRAIIQNLDSNVAFIAPTSYGKSSIIKEIIKQGEFNKIGIIVPTKSLLIQTYNDIKLLGLNYKLILHDDMYSSNNRFIGILTQERATRLIIKHNISFDIIIVDEAHNLFERDTRSFILSRLIQLNNLKNPQQKLVYLSPLIDDSENVKLTRTVESNIYTRKICHDLKISDFYLYDQQKSYAYDRFTGEFHDLNKATSYINYILQNSLDKNFIYHHRPKLVEELAILLSSKLDRIANDDNIKQVIKTLKEEVHNSFYLVQLVEKGVVYLHGKIPNVVKEYLEYKFKTISGLKYIVANNVILEGINLPVETLFITATYRLHGKELTNLIGRVNRLNYVFNRDNLDLLVSNIHFMNSQRFQGENDIRNKMKLLRDHSFDDVLKNPLLNRYDINKLDLTPENKEKRQKENKLILEATNTILVEDTSDDRQMLKKYFIENSIDVFYHDVDQAVAVILNKLVNHKFSQEKKIVDLVSDFFVLGSEGNIKDFEIERLKNNKAINYYNNFLEVTQKQSLKEKVSSTFKYFKHKATTSDPQLYIGSSYGEEIRYSEQYQNQEYSRPVYVNLRQGSDVKLVNWAIVKIKMEEDFVSFKLNKLIVFLYDYKIITEEFYYNYVYGTDKIQLIELIRFGLNVSIVKKLESDDQLKNLSFDSNGNLKHNDLFRTYISMQSELLKFEMSKYLSI